MNRVHLVTITRDNADGPLVYRFAFYDDAGRANYIAGECIDRLADATGESFWYEVTPLPYVTSLASGEARAIVNAAVAAVTGGNSD